MNPQENSTVNPYIDYVSYLQDSFYTINFSSPRVSKYMRSISIPDDNLYLHKVWNGDSDIWTTFLSWCLNFEFNIDKLTRERKNYINKDDIYIDITNQFRFDIPSQFRCRYLRSISASILWINIDVFDWYRYFRSISLSTLWVDFNIDRPLPILTFSIDFGPNISSRYRNYYLILTSILLNQ